MKTTQCLLFTVFGLHCALAADSVSIEDFKKMDGARQFEAIENARPEEKEMLKKIYVHRQIALHFRGEEGVLAAKKSCIASWRAHFRVTRIFDAERKLWQSYILQAALTLLKEGVSQKEIDETIAKSQQMLESAGAQRLLAMSLIYESAETPEAIALAKKSAKMAGQYLKTNPVTQTEEPSRAFSTEELMDLHRKAGEVFGELKKVPKIPEEKLRKEVDAFNEEFLLGR